MTMLIKRAVSLQFGAFCKNIYTTYINYYRDERKKKTIILRNIKKDAKFFLSWKI